MDGLTNPTPGTAPEPLPRGIGLRAALAGLGPAWRQARRWKARARYRLGRLHDADFAAFARLPGEGLFLDIGASAGQSAYSFRLARPGVTILSLEPLPQHREDLDFVARALAGFDYRLEAAAEHSGTASLWLPVYGGYELPAYASLDRVQAGARLARFVAGGADPRRLSLREVPVQLRRLDELGLAPGFAKIDVEGAEFAVLRGMSATLAAHRPVLMIEKTAQAGEWSRWLQDRFGYRCCTYQHARGEFTGWDGSQVLNLFFLPA